MFEIKIIKKIALNLRVWRVFFLKKQSCKTTPQKSMNVILKRESQTWLNFEPTNLLPFGCLTTKRCECYRVTHRYRQNHPALGSF